MLVEFASVVDAVRCAVEMQHGMAERNAGVAEGAAHRVPHRHQPRRRHRSRATTSSATASTSRRGWKASPSRAASASRDGACRAGARQARRSPSRIIGEQTLKNIARPMRVYRRRTRPMPRRRSATAGSRRSALPDKPSIAVLPFQNMSGDPEQEYFADGMVEDIITAPVAHSSGCSSSRAIRRFAYKGRAVDVRQVGARARRALRARRQRAQGRRTACASPAS